MLFDIVFGTVFDLLAPKTPWAWFVRLVVVAALIAAYLAADEADVLPWQ